MCFRALAKLFIWPKILWKFRSKRRAIQLKQVKYKPLFSIGTARARASVELLCRYWRFPAADITNGWARTKRQTKRQRKRFCRIYTTFITGRFESVTWHSALISTEAISTLCSAGIWVSLPRNTSPNYRMGSAVKQLTQRRISIKEVSAACGYVDVYSFTKAFKKH